MEVATGQAGVALLYIDIAFDKGQAVNIHGFRAESAIEPEVGDANANGLWAVWVLPGGVIQNADLPQTFGNFGNEDWAPYLWGYGPWVATNQTPAQIMFTPKSTRNMQAGGRVVFQILINGISSGLARHNETLTCFTTPIT